MQILPDGTVQIKNKRTGETKIVQPNDLPNFGISYDAYVNQAKNYQQIQGNQPVLQGQEDTTAKQRDAQRVREEAKTNAGGVLKVIEMGKSGKLTGKQFQDALNFAVSQYNKSSAFAEGGKTLTGSELGILAGSLIKYEPARTQNILEKLTGKQPTATGRVLDDVNTIENKMRLALGQDISQQPQQSPQDVSPTGDKSVQGFLQNVTSDIGANIQGIAALPGVLGEILTGKRSALETGKQVVGGIAQEYKDILTNPLETAYQRPVSTALDVLPFLQLGKAGLAGKAAKAAKVADEAGDVGKVAKILEAGKVPSGSKVSALSKGLYQSVLSISKKSNAFEKLNPGRTVEKMIEYGVKGSPDDIARVAEKVTGNNGILSKVVDNAVLDTNSVGQVERVYEFLNDNKKGRFSALGSDKIDELTARINTLPQAGKPGEVDLSRLLEMERTLQSEAVEHRIAGLKGDTAAKELSTLKFETADEIGNIIDEAVSNVKTLDTYKDPRIIAEIKKVSPRLAEQYKNAKTIKEVRSLQAPFVRMKKIIELAQNEKSSLGQGLFRPVSQIPGLGPILDVASQNVATPLATNAAVAINDPRIAKLLQAAAQAPKKPMTYNVGRNVEEYGY